MTEAICETSANLAASEMARRVLCARDGDESAFGDLVEMLWSQLVSLARVILAGDAEAEDMVQDAFVHAWRRLHSLRRPESFAAWMRRAVVRRCLRRAQRARNWVDLAEADQAVLPSDAPLEVAELLKRLAPRQRAVLYLGAVQGRSDREIGSLLGILPATVRVHRLRGRQQLQRLLEGGKP